MENTWISFVVDKDVKFYYQAELLLHSLIINSHFDKSTIIVQCIEGVDKRFISFLEDNNYRYTMILPFLDKKYCNKIAQLKYFKNKKVNIILLDTDVYVTNKIEIDFPNVINAKMVDGNNPPLTIINNIYKNANLKIPLVVKTDWNNDDTCKANFNGGFYYIPLEFIDLISVEWPKNATWLFNNKHLFGDKKYAIHIDQIAMSLAINNNYLPIHLMNSNNNYPIHKDLVCRNFDRTKNISVLHYHSGMDNFGLIDSDNMSDPILIQEIEDANYQIMAMESVFNKSYRERKKPNNFVSKVLNKIISKKKNLIIHGGTSKTGTTSLQFNLYENYDSLKAVNFVYSKDISKYTYSPKHQWLIDYLLNNRFGLLKDRLERSFSEIQEDQTLILSTEGLHNHWFDFSQEMKKGLYELSHVYNITFVIALREPKSYLMSLYKQNIKNKYHPEYFYGRSGGINRAFQDKWFRQHLNYLNFIIEIEEVFGKKNIKILKYDKLMIKQFYNLLKLDNEDFKKVISKNISFSNRDIKTLKFINKMKLKNRYRSAFLSLSLKINLLLNKMMGDIKDERIDPRIIQFLNKENKYLFEKYNI